MMKTCSKCGEDKKIEEFSPQKNAKDGHSSWCKACKAQRESDRRRENGVLEKKSPRVSNEQEKECLRCHIIFPLAAFDNSPRGRMGRASYCRECTKEYSRDPKFREMRRKHAIAHMDRNRDKWRFLLKGGLHDPENLVMACSSCNSSKKDRDLGVFLDDLRRQQGK